MRRRLLNIIVILAGCALPVAAMAGSSGASTLFGDDSDDRRGERLDFSEPDRSESDSESDAIYGGGLIDDASWPETAALMDAGEPFCTGTLIAPEVVLTAGHCLEDGVLPEEIELGGGRRAGGETIAVADGLAYPRWEGSYDVALLFLDRPAETEPRTMALECVVDEALMDGARVTLVGFGETEERSRTGRKNAVATAIRDADCDALDSFECVEGVSPGGELVAGGFGRDTCYGDSGGPLYLMTSQGPYLAGVTSRGATGAVRCGSGGIYVRPDAVLGWIEDEMAEAGIDEPLPMPDCSLDHSPSDTEIVQSVSASAAQVGCQEQGFQSLGAFFLLLPLAPTLRRREDRS